MKKYVQLIMLAGLLFAFPACQERDNDSASEEYREEKNEDQQGSDKEGAEDSEMNQGGNQQQ